MSRSTSSLKQHLHAPLSPPCDGSPSSSCDTREEDLCLALDTAIGSLPALGGLYEQREMRWIEERHRFDNNKERICCCSDRCLALVSSTTLLRQRYNYILSSACWRIFYFSSTPGLHVLVLVIYFLNRYLQLGSGQARDSRKPKPS